MGNGLLDCFSDLDRAALIAEHAPKVGFSAIPLRSFLHLGPAVELAIRAQGEAVWSKFAKTSMPKVLSGPLRNAHRSKLHTHTATAGNSTVGFMCLESSSEATFRPALHAFCQAARPAMQFKRNIGQGRGLVCGAIGEMVDNVLEHSGAINTGIVAYSGNSEHFDVCVGDAGIGILASLHQNPAYAYLSDAGMALSLAVQDGTSRYPTAVEEGHGHGFSTLFRGLNSLDAEIRIRSGNYALEVGGRAIRERSPTISQKANLIGLVVSFRTYF